MSVFFEYSESWLKKQSLDRSWRPANYYGELSRKLGILPQHSQDYDRLLRDIFVSYHENSGYVSSYDEDDTFDIGSPEILLIDNDRVVIVEQSAGGVSTSLQDDFSLPEEDYNEISHKALRKSILKKVSPHWVVETWLVICGGSVIWGNLLEKSKKNEDSEEDDLPLIYPWNYSL